MASVGLVSLGFTGAYVAVGGRMASPAAVVATTLLVLVVLNGAAAWALFAPVRRALAGDGSPESAYVRLNRLPALSACVVFATGFAYSAWVFASGRYVADPEQLLTLSTRYKLLALLWFALVYAAYFALYAAVLANACARLAREQLSRRKPPPESHLQGRLVLRLSLLLAFLTVVPSLVIVMDLTLLAPLRRAQGLSTQEVIFLDLLATLAAGGLAAVFAARQVTGPLNQLELAVARVAQDDYDQPAPVSGNDELGRLTLHFNRMTEGLRERAIIRREFGRYLSPAIATRILDSALGDGPPQRGGELREATILFSDLEGFTPLTARLPAAELIALLEQYFRLIDEVVREHGGIVQSFIGDAVHASFNFAQDCPEHAAAALQAALEIQQRLAHTKFPGDEPMRTRIGVHTGVVAAGAIGSTERMNYAMFGSAVNVAMRLEQLNKERGTLILASAETVAGCPPARRARFALAELGAMQLRGCPAPVTVYEVRPAPPQRGGMRIAPSSRTDSPLK